jgi:branched-chain amino acid transport system permease protein
VPITIALRSYLGTTAPGLHMIIYGLILVLTVLYMPQGLYGTLKARMAGRAGQDQK